jgi:hypothetical protein
LYPYLENSTTGIAIMYSVACVDFDLNVIIIMFAVLLDISAWPFLSIFLKKITDTCQVQKLEGRSPKNSYSKSA